jgi:archaellum component FlaC
MMLMLNREELLKEQVEIYQQQYTDIEKNIGGTTKNFQHFKKEIERVTQELKKVSYLVVFQIK